MTHQKIQTSDGRTLSFADYGKPSDIAVLCCHGGPGSRMEAKRYAQAASEASFRLIGIDRPGYGGTTALPGRSICDWTHDALAIANHLGLQKFFTQGNSTGGSYSLATASVAPERVLGVLVCCGMSDMSWANEVDEARMDNALPIWNTPDRNTAIAVAADQFGDKGEKMMEINPDVPPLFSPPDMAAIMDPAFAANDPTNESFAQGVVGYADDRIADGPANGWSSFDISRVRCPVIVIHGEQDWIVPIAHARHTVSILKNAELRTFPEHGHLSVGAEAVNSLIDLRSKTDLSA
jgi:pimeloyl-ACP methyl ester carboxylesterase